MLGQTGFGYLSHRGWNVIGTQFTDPRVPWYFDAAGDPKYLRHTLDTARCDYVINCIGILRDLVRENDAASMANVIRVNSLLPHLLADSAAKPGIRVISISTDG